MVASSITNGLNPLASPLTLFIVQLLIIVIVSRVLNYILSYVKQPPVIAEVITGILLGPSVLSRAKAFQDNVFPVGTSTGFTVLNVIANIGLIFFMFMIGLEVDAGILKKNIRNSMIISLSSIILPFAMGIGLAAALFDTLAPAGHEFGIFCVFVGVAISITAFPVLARILTERNLMHSKVGVISLAAASVDDVIAWILLAVVVSYAKNTGSGSNLTALWTFLLLAAFIAFMFLPVRMALSYIYRNWVKTQAHKHNLIIVLLMCMFASAFFTEVIGVHAIFGAFILGVVVPREDSFHLLITERIETIVTIVLLPLYFTFSGLRTNLSSINSAMAGGLTIVIICVACIGKITGATLASKFCGNGWRESFTVGFLMNTKGLVELIVLNIGLDIGILDQTLFTMFVVMALVTTFITTPVVHFIWTKYQKEHGDQDVQMSTNHKGRFNILLYLAPSNIGNALVNIAGAIISPESAKKYNVKGIYPHESSDGRPSTYAFAHKPKSFPPAVKDNYDAVEAESKNVGIKIKPILVNSVDMYHDINVLNLNSDLILLGASSNQSADKELSLGLSDNTSVFSSAFGKDISRVIENCKSSIGVVVDKGMDRFNRQHHLLFVYTGNEFEKESLEILLRMATRTNITVSVVSNCCNKVSEKVQQNGLEASKFTFIESSDPHSQALSMVSSENDYWLAIMGSERENTMAHTTIIQQTTVSLLFVLPSSSYVRNQDHLEIDG
ncbi:hypothetical protein CYY_006241 [Polysphondylium violaceum]|uniref:Cation/H+ exchanger transmembrane domain-containing protein n=1 Tax=Polysphondylium violaceum TaxID=133409 RepID=A0A8J4UZ42_9MYCE|nr:hypothetical protein CYY_006241 [Polysphondylium violaceum]